VAVIVSNENHRRMLGERIALEDKEVTAISGRAADKIELDPVQAAPQLPYIYIALN
jgi:hypothetical protein